MKIGNLHIVKTRPKNKKPSIGSVSLNGKKGKIPLQRSVEHLHQLAFDHSLLPNIISIVSDGRIIDANLAACQLLEYSKKVLLTKNMRDIFAFSYNNFKQILKKREKTGHAIGNLPIIKKDGNLLPAQITSVVFIGENRVKKAITTFVDRSEGIAIQKNIDFKKNEQVAADIIFAKTKANESLSRVDELEHTLDKEITAKENIQISLNLQQKIFEDDWKEEIKLKKAQIADAIIEAKQLERTDIGKELHDNVNQLLAASRLYLDIARNNKSEQELYLSRSSEYMLTAIEEIRKLTKGLVSDVLKNLGLCHALNKICQDIMELNPIKIVCTMDETIHPLMKDKFNLNVFRIVQEQLSNIVKHSKASLVTIDLSQNKVSIILSISDNGIGFNTKKKAKGIGIENIKSRASFFKGVTCFTSQPGQGCVVSVIFPRTGGMLDKGA
jgi:PAS domain S-box-containing protein